MERKGRGRYSIAFISLLRKYFKLIRLFKFLSSKRHLKMFSVWPITSAKSCQFSPSTSVTRLFNAGLITYVSLKALRLLLVPFLSLRVFLRVHRCSSFHAKNHSELLCCEHLVLDLLILEGVILSWSLTGVKGFKYTLQMYHRWIFLFHFTRTIQTKLRVLC